MFNNVAPQCHAGHLVCSNCRPKLTCCPTCRGQLGGNIRNLAMEKVPLSLYTWARLFYRWIFKVASTVMFPCKYSSGGCTVSLLHTEKVILKSYSTRYGTSIARCLSPPKNTRWITRKPASSDLTLVLALVLVVSGREALNRFVFSLQTIKCPPSLVHFQCV